MDTNSQPSQPSQPSISLEQLCQQLQQQNAILQQQINQLMQQQASSVPPSSPKPVSPAPNSLPLPPSNNYAHTSFGSSGIKVAPPDVYDGTISKADTFISQLHLYFHGKRVYNGIDRVVTALSYMKGGTAGSWAKGKVKWMEGLEPGTEVDWDDFVQEFKRTFGDPNPGSTARHKMSQLRQESHSADEYVAKFRELKDETGYNDVALVEKFIKGLDQSLVDRIYHLPEMPKNLEGWISWAVKLDRQKREREVEKKNYNFFSRPSSKPQPQSISTGPPSNSIKQQHLSIQPKQPDVVPMEVDSGWKAVKPLVCFKCRKPGHKAINCRSKVDINSMDYDAIKAHMKREIQMEEISKEDKQKEEDF